MTFRLERGAYAQWLLDQFPGRVFLASSAGCNPIAVFLRETQDLPGVGVFRETWKPRPKARRFPLPAWAVAHLDALEADLQFITAARALQHIRGNP
jgi:hypothetical protein